MTSDFAAVIKRGGIGIMPTDTIYGLVGSALSKKAVLRIYTIRKRNPKKPCIILISSLRDLAFFGIHPKTKTRALLAKLWPGKVSIILPCPLKKFSYLHRGTRTLAFRLPKKQPLIGFLKKTGPLVAPSANPEGEKPAKTIREAKKYFGKSVDFYWNGGYIQKKSSKLVKITRDLLEVLRT